MEKASKVYHQGIFFGHQGFESPASLKHVSETLEDVDWFVEGPWLLSFNGFAQFQDCCTELIIKWHTSVGAVTTTPKSMHEGFPLEEVGKTRMNEVNRSHML